MNNPICTLVIIPCHDISLSHIRNQTFPTWISYHAFICSCNSFKILECKLCIIFQTKNKDLFSTLKSEPHHFKKTLPGGYQNRSKSSSALVHLLFSFYLRFLYFRSANDFSKTIQNLLFTGIMHFYKRYLSFLRSFFHFLKLMRLAHGLDACNPFFTHDMSPSYYITAV